VTTSTYGAEPGVLAIAHRGGPSLGPENTAEAFERSIGLGLRYLETDVRTTSDGVCVAFHDRTLRRLTGRPGRLSDLSWADVRGLRVDGVAAVPRLEDLLTAWPEVRWVIDVKQTSALVPLVQVLRRTHAAARICLSGPWEGWLEEAAASLGPDVSTAVGWSSLPRIVAGGRPGGRSARYLHLPLRLGEWRVPSARLVQRAHDQGLRALVWGVHGSLEMHQLLDDGVDGIITDRPDVLRAVLVGRGAWRAPDARPPAAARPRTPVGYEASAG